MCVPQRLSCTNTHIHDDFAQTGGHGRVHRGSLADSVCTRGDGSRQLWCRGTSANSEHKLRCSIGLQLPWSLRASPFERNVSVLRRVRDARRRGALWTHAALTGDRVHAHDLFWLVRRRLLLHRPHGHGRRQNRLLHRRRGSYPDHQSCKKVRRRRSRQ